MKTRVFALFISFLFGFAGLMLAQQPQDPREPLPSPPILSPKEQAVGSAISSDDQFVVRYVRGVEIFHWIKVGGQPVVPGGVPTREAFQKFIASERFAWAMNELGLSDRTEEAREKVAADRFEDTKIEPNTSSALFLKMTSSRGSTKRPTMWAGKEPLDSWVVYLENMMLVIPKGCANVAVTHGHRIIREPGVTREVPCKPATLTLTPPALPAKDSPPCDPNWSWGIIGEYNFFDKHSRAKKVRLNPDKFVTFPTDTLERQKIVDLIAKEDKDFFRRKVHSALALYNNCNGRVKLGWYKESWHWKEFFVGFIAGFGAGWFTHGAFIEEPALPAGKLPGFPPVRPGVSVASEPLRRVVTHVLVLK